MKRIRYYDWLRVTSFCLIIYYHMMVQLRLVGSYPEDIVNALVSNRNMHVATLAVAIFFILSGAGLTFSYAGKNKIDVREYYSKRLIRILVPFYVVMIITLVVRSVKLGGIANVYSGGIPVWRIVFTLFGMDEWMSMHGVATFSLGIGEWFLGCLMVLYLVFPLLYLVMKRNPWIFLGITTGVYVITAFYYRGGVPIHMHLLVKGYEFCIGMLLGMYEGYKRNADAKHNTKCESIIMVLAAVVALGIIACPVEIVIPKAFKITLLAVCVFVACAGLEPILDKMQESIPNRMVGWASRFSYEIYLVHHEVIYLMTPLAVAYLPGAKTVLVLFVTQIIVMVAVAILVHIISEFLKKIIGRTRANKVE